MGLVSELRRRDVFRMAALYVVAAWLVMQVAEVVIGLANLPEWFGQTVLVLLAIGFPIALAFSWFFEVTPQGLSLEKDVPDGQSITHVTGQRMDFIIIAILAAAVLLFAYDKWGGRPAEESIAVLPFIAISGVVDDGFFADGLSEEIINSLAHVPELMVTARTSAWIFKGQNQPVPEIASALGVAYVLEGSVRRLAGAAIPIEKINDSNLDGAEVVGGSKSPAILAVRDLDTPGASSVLHSGGLQDGVSGFNDREGQHWSDIPDGLIGADYIESAQDNADITEEAGLQLSIEVDVAEGAILYLFIHEDQIDQPFDWMTHDIFGSEWVDTGLKVYSYCSTFSVWRTAAPLNAGTYTFRQQSVDSSFYGIAGSLGDLDSNSWRAAEYRIAAQLIRGRDGLHVWSQTYDRSSADLGSLQADVAEDVARALGVLLDAELVRKMRQIGMNNPEAFIAFQKGRNVYQEAHSVSSNELMCEASNQFSKVIGLEPEYAPAYWYRADFNIHRAFNPRTPNALELARRDLERASRFASDNIQRLSAQLTLALINQEWRRLRQLSDTVVDSGECFEVFWGMPQLVDDRTRLIRAAQRNYACDPLNPETISWYSWAEFLSGNTDKSVAILEKSLARIPLRQLASTLVDVHLARKDFAAARAANNRYVNDQGWRDQYTIKILAAEGRKKELKEFLTSLYGLNGSRELAHYAMLGDREKANDLASEIDRRPLAAMRFFESLSYCQCGAAFDLKATPNFAAVVDQADLSWPPESPIDWPLKIW